ncbi:hypothetical protein Q4525_13860 [Shimia thalassica]|uniref:hypothetical protein n=1 Tax=Shimia thalassica TaxID=1715693 RepID=UPI001C08A394|nr:hypothetical protein [Shimia thalassica]MBU2941598.1 hypothetical protein [Shimia thalassica]MDO6504021.1 hypothetical protein [Shimia thalassica]
MIKTLFKLSSLVVFAALAPMAATAQEETKIGPRETYNEAREEMDALIKQRRLGDAIRMFESLGQPDNKELAALDTKMRVLYKTDFTEVALIRSEIHKNGFRQEIIGYWNDEQYLYVYLLMHTVNNRPRLLNFRFDADFHALNMLF